VLLGHGLVVREREQGDHGTGRFTHRPGSTESLPRAAIRGLVSPCWTRLH
jgi:hypothetical protein